MNLRRLRSLIRREALATLRSPFTLSVLILVPLGALLVFGFILSTEVNGLYMGILDSDQSPASRRLIADLTAKDTFRAVHYQSRPALEADLINGTISVGLIIPPDFDRKRRQASDEDLPQVQILYDGAEAVLAGNAEGFLRSLIANSVLPATAPSGTTTQGLRQGIQLSTTALFNPTLDGKPFMVSGTFGFVLSFLTVLLTAVSIVNEKLTGTFEQMQVTPATAVEILLGKILPLGAVFTLDVILMLFIAGLVLDVWPAGSTIFFVIVSGFYVLVSLATGVIISATSTTAAEAVQKSVMLSIPLVQLSGFAFPIRNMPYLVQWVAELFPATHYIRVTRAIYMRGEGPLALAPELALLLLFGALLMVYALRRIEART